MNLPLPNRLSLSLTYLTSHHPPLLITTPHLSSPHSTLIWPHFALPPLLTAFGWWRSNSMWGLDGAVLICDRDQWSINKTLLLEMTKYIIITDLPISKIKHVTKFWRLSNFYLYEQNTFFTFVSIFTCLGYCFLVLQIVYMHAVTCVGSAFYADIHKAYWWEYNRVDSMYHCRSFMSNVWNEVHDFE